MKRILICLLLFAGCNRKEQELQEPLTDGRMVVEQGVDRHAPVYELEVYADAVSEIVMAVNGILSNTNGGWQRPAAMTDVDIRVWTADGREWEACWLSTNASTAAQPTQELHIVTSENVGI